MRAFADGFVSLLLPVYLLELGFIKFAIGSSITTTLLVAALLMFWIEALYRMIMIPTTP